MLARLCMLLIAFLPTQILLVGQEISGSPLDDPERTDYSFIRPIDELPRYDPAIVSGFQVDLRSRDLSSLDMTGREYDLAHSIFDNYTAWPDLSGVAFDPWSILLTGLSPGLGLREIHDSGIDGRGVKVAVIDQFMHSDHLEFQGRVEYMRSESLPYQRINTLHARLVTSILAGEHTGVAPGVDVVFIGRGSAQDSCVPDIVALRTVLSYNQSSSQPIQIVTLSTGANRERPGYDEYLEAIQEVEASGVVVFTPDLLVRHPEYAFYGLSKSPTADPNDPAVYSPIEWDEWIVKIHNAPGLQEDYCSAILENPATRLPLLLPLDGTRTVAGPLTERHYWFKYVSGWSELPPYLAGLFALCRQIDREIDLAEFWAAAYASGEPLDHSINGIPIAGRMVLPAELVAVVQQSQDQDL